MRLKTTRTAVTTARMISFVVIGRDYDNRLGWAASRSSDCRSRRFSVAVVLAALGVGRGAGALSDWQALALGVVQGFTELLPISSSGHLILVPWLADWHFLEENDAFNQTFDVALHLGTLVAVVVYFWRDIVWLVRALCAARSGAPGRDSDERIAWFIVVATIPAADRGRAGRRRDRGRISASRGRSRSCSPSSACCSSSPIGAGPTARIGDLALAPRRRDGRRAEPRAHARGLPLGDHDHRRALRSGSTATRRRGSRSCCSSRRRSARSSARASGTCSSGDLPPAGRGRSSSACSPPPASGLVAIDGLLGYVRPPRLHGRSSSTGSSLAAVILLLIATGVREATF